MTDQPTKQQMHAHIGKRLFRRRSDLGGLRDANGQSKVPQPAGVRDREGPVDERERAGAMSARRYDPLD